MQIQTYQGFLRFGIFRQVAVILLDRPTTLSGMSTKGDGDGGGGGGGGDKLHPLQINLVWFKEGCKIVLIWFWFG